MCTMIVFHSQDLFLLFYSAAQALCIDFPFREQSKNSNTFGPAPSSTALSSVSMVFFFSTSQIS